MLQAQRIQLHRRRMTRFIGFHHAAPTTGVAADRGQANRIVHRQQSGINQRANQRDRAGGVTAWIADALGTDDGLALSCSQLRKSVDPALCRAVRGGGVDDLGARLASFRRDRVDHGHRFHGGIVMQAQHHQIGLGHQGALGQWVFAQGGGNAQNLHARHVVQAFADLQTGGTGFAVDKNFFHGVREVRT